MIQRPKRGVALVAGVILAVSACTGDTGQADPSDCLELTPSGGSTGLVSLSLSLEPSVSTVVNHDVRKDVGPVWACLDTYVNIEDLTVDLAAELRAYGVVNAELGLVDARIAGVVRGDFASVKLNVDPAGTGIVSTVFDARVTGHAGFHVSASGYGFGHGWDIFTVHKDQVDITVDGVAPILLWPRANGSEHLVCRDWDPPDNPLPGILSGPAGVAYDHVTRWKSYRVDSDHHWRQFEPAPGDLSVSVATGPGADGPYIVGFFNPISEFSLDSVWGEAADQLGFVQPTNQPGPLMPSWLNAYAASKVSAYPELDPVTAMRPHLSTEQCP